MWTIIYYNIESGKTIWESGFGRYILNRLDFLFDNWQSFEVKMVYKEPWSWKAFVGCLFHYRGIVDEESIAAEGRVE